MSRFSTNGALVLADAQDVDRFYQQLLACAGIVVAIGPLLARPVFAVPGRL